MNMNIASIGITRLLVAFIIVIWSMRFFVDFKTSLYASGIEAMPEEVQTRFEKIFLLITKIVLYILILMLCVKIFFIPNYTTEATVKAVGGEGVTVSYSDRFGENEKTANVNVISVSDYDVGDTITIEVYDIWIKEAGR